MRSLWRTDSPGLRIEGGRISSHPCSPEIDKLDVGECCFGKIEAANGKLFVQLLAAAVNLRTYMEAIERDRRVFVGPQEARESEMVEMLQLR